VAELYRLDRIERAKAGDPDAFWSVVEPHDRGLRSLAYRLLEDRDLMDDALQEAYLKAFRALPSFRGESGVASWLYRIVYNTCLDQLRRVRRTRHVSLEAASELADPGANPEEASTRKRDLAEAMAALPTEMRAAVLLVDAEGMNYADAAEVLGIARGTVASRLNRARLCSGRPSRTMRGRSDER
jgi:RNA polymerase sigma-70 factor, ECF subfamily